MSRLPGFVIIFVLSIGCARFRSAVHAQTKAPRKAPTSTVSGRVTIHGKGAAGVAIGIRSADFSPVGQASPKGTSDQDGFYRIVDVPPGNYVVSPLSLVYVTEYNSRFRSRGKSLLLAEGENVEGIDFSLERGGVITGRVTDADGRPVVEERISLVQADQAKQQGQGYIPPVVPNAFMTDDRGVYRIYGIPEGRYKISVGQTDDGFSTGLASGRVPYRRTFYPDTTDANEARIVEVTEGSETADVDIRLGRRVPGFTASGKVVDGANGRPVAGLRFALRRVLTQGFASVNSSIPSNSQGEFQIDNVTPGKYAVLVLPMQGNELRAESATFEVVDQDVTGIVVKTSLGLSITGTVVVDGKTDPSVLAKLAQLRLSAYVRNDNSGGAFGQGATVNPDGSFRIGGLGPGLANFSLGSQDNLPLTTFAILRVERDGVALPRGVDLKAGENVTGVKVVLKYGTGSIRGEIKFENGELPAEGRVNVWISKGNEPPGESNVRPRGVDSRGHFLIEGVPAGDYELNVNTHIPNGRKPLPVVKQAVTVSEGGVTDVVVSVDLAANPQTPPPE